MVGSNEGQILCAVARLNAAEQVTVLLWATMRLPAAFMVAFWSGRPSTFFKAAIDVSGRAEWLELWAELIETIGRTRELSR